jgi:hypothetical protein
MREEITTDLGDEEERAKIQWKNVGGEKLLPWRTRDTFVIAARVLVEENKVVAFGASRKREPGALFDGRLDTAFEWEDWARGTPFVAPPHLKKTTGGKAADVHMCREGRRERGVGRWVGSRGRSQTSYLEDMTQSGATKRGRPDALSKKTYTVLSLGLRKSTNRVRDTNNLGCKRSLFFVLPSE